MRAEFVCRAVKWRVIFALMHWRWGMPQNLPAALCSFLKLEAFASAGAGLDLLFHAYGGWVCGQGKDQGCLLSLHLLPPSFSAPYYRQFYLGWAQALPQGTRSCPIPATGNLWDTELLQSCSGRQTG